MGKMKVYELAKELNMQSKELVEKLIDLKYDIKNHMSTLEDAEVEKVMEHFKGKDKQKNKKPVAPVIIRREVTRIETTDVKPVQQNRNNRDDLGVVQRRTDTSMNIKYRTNDRRTTPASNRPQVNRDNVVSKPAGNEVIKPVIEEKKILPVEEKQSPVNKEEVKPVNKEVLAEKKPYNQNRDRFDGRGNREGFDRNRNNNGEGFDRNRNNNRENFDRNRSGNREGFDRNRNNNREGFDRNRNGGNREGFDRNRNVNSTDRPRGNFDRNRNGFDKNGSGPNRGGFQKSNNQFSRNRDNKVEKDMKTISSLEAPNKEPARETVRTGYKDKEKDSRKFEESTKKTAKTKSSKTREDINMGKLKDLQSENKLSHMFNDTDSKMFDYYDLSRGNGFKKNKKKHIELTERTEQKIFQLKEIDIPATITVKELAEKMKKQAGEVIKKLLGYGILATLNNELDFDTAFLVAGDFGITANKKEAITDEEILFDDTDDEEKDLVSRPPVVVVMGHVDHGKTSLLDAIRSTNVIEKEAGGITQHIGAYKVKIGEREITFLDTPGHEAFTAMRARGAQVTDIAIIIVAADDGIMPQTIEAINHAKAANVSIIVAINKIDKPDANIDRVKQELMEYGLVPEEWGGDTICVPISAKQNKNIDGLLEMVLLVADMKNLKTNPDKQAKGTILEARLDKNTGITASLLVQRGTLSIGDTIVVGSVIGRIRGMIDDKGQKVRNAGPSTPVEVTGLTEVPDAGEVFYEVENEKVAKHLIEQRKSKLREDMIRNSTPVTLDNLFNQIEQGKLKDLNIIIKADFQGSVQAIRQSLEKIQNEEARVRIIHANVGGITESDVTLAKVTNSIIIGFNVRPETTAKSIADKEKVEIKLYSVIYNAIDDVTSALKGMLKPKYKEVIQGTAEVRQVFKITNVGMIAGCYVLDGKIVRNSGVRVLRDNIVIHEGKLVSLKREKDDAKDVAVGYECGVQVQDYNDIKVGDHIESFIMEEIKR